MYANAFYEASNDPDQDGFVDYVLGNYASPGAHREFSEARTLVDTTVRLLTVPPVAGSYEIQASTPKESWSVELENDDSSARADSGVRSGRVTLTAEEPERMMCEKVKRRAPLTGSVDVTVTCLGDGLVSVLL